MKGGKCVFANVIVDIVHANVAHTFTYRIPDQISVQPGQRVSVPFGYQQKEGTTTAQIMSVNADGSVGLSTISEWKYENGKAWIKLTHGQNALNLAKEGAAGTMLVKAQGPVYLLHLKTAAVTVLEYSEETAGQFDQHYSGAANALNEYDIEFDVTAIEQTFALMF